MPLQVVNGATTACSFGMAPGVLVVTPEKRVACLTGGAPAANILDFVPMKNIMPFGMCTTPSNPAVTSATAAAQGVLTPMPCVPVVTGPWTPGHVGVMVGPALALDQACTCMCAWGGVITITQAGQATVDLEQGAGGAAGVGAGAGASAGAGAPRSSEPTAAERNRQEAAARNAGQTWGGTEDNSGTSGDGSAEQPADASARDPRQQTSGEATPETQPNPSPFGIDSLRCGECFAPGHESLQISYTLRDPETRLTSIRIEISDKDGKLCHTATESDGLGIEAGEHTYEYDGATSGCSSTPRTLTILASPYSIKATIQGNGDGSPLEQTTQVKVLLHSIEVEPFMPEAYLGSLPAPERASIQAFLDGTDGSIGGLRKLIIEPGIFMMKDRELYDDTRHSMLLEAWPHGPRLMYRAKLKCKTLAGAAVESGPAMVGLPVVWECLEPHNGLPDTPHLKQLLAEANDGIEYGSRNCTTRYGGRRDADPTKFPNLAPPFSQVAVIDSATKSTKAWRLEVASGNLEQDGAGQARNAVKLIPSPMSGDTYQAAAFPMFDGTGWSLDTGADFGKLSAPLSATSDPVVIMHRVRVHPASPRGVAPAPVAAAQAKFDDCCIELSISPSRELTLEEREDALARALAHLDVQRSLDHEPVIANDYTELSPEERAEHKLPDGLEFVTEGVEQPDQDMPAMKRGDAYTVYGPSWAKGGMTADQLKTLIWRRGLLEIGTKHAIEFKPYGEFHDSLTQMNLNSPTGNQYRRFWIPTKGGYYGVLNSAIAAGSGIDLGGPGNLAIPLAELFASAISGPEPGIAIWKFEGEWSFFEAGRVVTSDPGVTGVSSQRDRTGVVFFSSRDERWSAHEFGHAMCLPHAKDAPGGSLSLHSPTDPCLMSYVDGDMGFCAFCQLRLRGWSAREWTDPKDIEMFAKQL